jgi:hypothetical protein
LSWSLSRWKELQDIVFWKPRPGWDHLTTEKNVVLVHQQNVCVGRNHNSQFVLSHCQRGQSMVYGGENPRCGVTSQKNACSLFIVCSRGLLNAGLRAKSKQFKPLTFGFIARS